MERDDNMSRTDPIQPGVFSSKPSNARRGARRGAASDVEFGEGRPAFRRRKRAGPEYGRGVFGLAEDLDEVAAG